jgi:beta-galactosidase
LDEALSVPADRWGYFKVPGSWPSRADYKAKVAQVLYRHPSWRDEKLGLQSAAWYQREFTVPHDWAGRRISISADYLQSFATVFVDGKAVMNDGKPVSNIYFPGGEVDITALCRPGETQALSVLVLALPLAGVKLSYADSAAPKEASPVSAIDYRGFCGDVFLVGAPSGPRLRDVKIGTSVRKGEITVESGLSSLRDQIHYRLRARISDHGLLVKEFTGQPFTAADLKDGRMAAVEPWKAEKLWDTHTSQNMYELELALLDADGKELDVAIPERFGYREMWIDGRDFYLNGSRIFISSIGLESASNPVLATYDRAKEAMLRMKTFGINFCYTGNFTCHPGVHVSFADVLRAADDTGMLVSFTQPHLSGYENDFEESKAAYAQHAEFYVRMAQNHPSVVCYSMNHNAGGYHGDMDPDQIDGKTQRKQSQTLRIMAKTEAIVRKLDSTRIVYNHAAGDFGVMHTINFYPNFVPKQELSDWFQHWADEGVKPVFTNEYGAPFAWDWTMFRGWYKTNKGQMFGGAVVPWEFCMAEWNAQFLGDSAFQISENEKKNLRWEAKQLKDDKLWHRWDYPVRPGSSELDEQSLIKGMYFSDNFRAFRTLGVTGISPWEYHLLFKRRPGVDTTSKPATVDWNALQKPGFSLDFTGGGHEVYQQAYERSDWIPTFAAQALMRNNMPLLAYVAGKSGQVTSKDHNVIRTTTSFPASRSRSSSSSSITRGRRCPAIAAGRWLSRYPWPAPRQ